MVFAGYGVDAPEYQLGRLQGRRCQGQDDRRARQRSAGPRSVGPVEARRQDVQRQGDDLLRPLDLQVRGGRAEGRRRRPDRSRDRPGRLSVLRSCRATCARSSISSRPTRTWAASAIEGWVTLDAAKRHPEDGRAGLRRAEEAGADARLQAGAARAQGVARVKNTLRTIDSRNVARQARRQRPAAARTSTSSIRRTGIISASAHRSTATRSTTARSTMRQASRQLLEIAQRASRRSSRSRSARSCSSWSPPRSRGCSARSTTR